MLINNLSFLETVSEKESVSGSATLEVESYALAIGNDTLASTVASSDVKTEGNGNVTQGQGYGKALAVGDTAIAGVGVSYAGFDKVKVIVDPNSGQGDGYAYEGLKAMLQPFQGQLNKI